MATFTKLLMTVILLSIFILTNAFGQTETDDFKMRESTAARIMKCHGIQIDWRNTSLLDMTDIEARLSTVKRIKMDHGVTFDWQKISLLQLSDAEARMNTAKRIGQATKKAINWQEHSLEDLLRMESGLIQASMNPGTVTLSFDALFPPSNQKAMGLQKLTRQEKEELRKHVETILFAAAQTGAQQQIGARQNTPRAERILARPRVYAGVGGGHWIMKNVDGGTYIVLEDESVWKIDPFDKIDAMLWLPVSRITVAESPGDSPGYDYLLINTDDKRKAHANYTGKQ